MRSAGMAKSSSSQLASDIRRLIEERAPSSCCDACFALHFAVSLAEARAVAMAVADVPGYKRQEAVCDSCNRTLELTAVTLKLKRRN